MKVERVLSSKRYAGNVQKLAAELHISDKAVYAWGANVPWLQQFHLEVITEGEFKARRKPPSRARARV